MSLLGKLLPQAGRICQVSVMGQAEIAPIIEHFQRLDIVGHTAARRGITDMTNADIPVKTLESRFENIGYQAHILFHMDVLSIADNNPRTFLTAVLQCKSPQYVLSATSSLWE